MKILVTGANGYLGQGIVKSLLDKGADVIATDRKTTCIDVRAKAIAVDLFTVEDPFVYFGQPDIVLHLAWRDGFRHNSHAHIEDLPKHYDFLKKLSESKIKKIAVMGSMHEIGFYEGSIDENTPTNPQSLYGISKNALRNSVKLLTDTNKNNFQWLRGYYIVGNSQYGSSIFSKITQSATEGKKNFPFTSGMNQYDFLDYTEFCHQVASAVMQDKINGIINCCSGFPQTLASRVEKFIKDNAYEITLDYGAYPDRPYDSKAVWGNNTKINNILDDLEK